jgi:hypothetical protein
MANQVYPPELKAQVIADFAMGMSKSAIAKKHAIGRTTVIDWISQTEPPVPTLSDTLQKDHLGQLVYDYLVTGFEALIVQNRLAADIAYLKGSAVPLPALYDSIHAGVVAVAQAIDRGSADNDGQAVITGSPSAGG